MIVAIIFILLGVINLFALYDEALMGITFIISGLLILSNRVLDAPTAKVILGVFITGATFASHVDIYTHNMGLVSLYGHSFLEVLYILWNSIFTSFPAGYEEMADSRNLFLLALAITIIFILIDVVVVADCPSAGTTAYTPTASAGTSTRSREIPCITSDNERHYLEFSKRLKELEQVYGLLQYGDHNKYYDRYFSAQVALAQTCAHLLYDNYNSQDKYITAVREFVNVTSKKYPWLRLVGPEGSAVYRWSSEDLSKYIGRVNFYYGAFQCDEITYQQWVENCISS